MNRAMLLREKIGKLPLILSHTGVTITQEGTSAFVRCNAYGKPTLVNLPYIADNASEELMDAIEGFLDHEVAHLLFTDFKLTTKSRKEGFGALHELLEDACVETQMGKRFPGCNANLSETGRFYLRKAVEPALNSNEVAGDPAIIQGILMAPALRAWAGQLVYQDFMRDHWPKMQDIATALGALVHEVELCKNTEDTYALAKKMAQALNDYDPSLTQPASQEGEAGDAGEAGEQESGKSQQQAGSEQDNGQSPQQAGHQDPGQQQEGAGQNSAGTGQQEDGEQRSQSGSAQQHPEGAGQGADQQSDGGQQPDGKMQGPDLQAGGGQPARQPEGKEQGPDQQAGGGQPGQPPEANEQAASASKPEPSDSGKMPSALGMAPKFDDIRAASETSDSSDQAGQQGQGGEEGQEGQEGQSGLAAEGKLGQGAERLGVESFARTINKMMENNFDKKLIQLIGEHAVAANDHSPYRVYSTDHDEIETLPVPSSSYIESWLRELDSAVMHLCGPMQKNLERMIAARSIATWQPARRSGRLHAASLSRLACNDARVFRKKIEGKSRDVAVELVVDCSGSMGGAKIYLATQAAYALSTVLGRLNIANEVIGFTTGRKAMRHHKSFEKEARKHDWQYARYESLYMPIIKGYNERMTANVRNRFAWLPHSGILSNNVDGECVEIAARRLAQRREKGKIMLVLSDGEPSAYGDHRMLQKHLKRVVKEIESSGITVVGLGIHSTAVKHYYSKHLVVTDLEQLPTEVLKQLKELIVTD